MKNLYLPFLLSIVIMLTSCSKEEHIILSNEKELIQNNNLKSQEELFKEFNHPYISNEIIVNAGSSSIDTLLKLGGEIFDINFKGKKRVKLKTGKYHKMDFRLIKIPSINNKNYDHSYIVQYLYIDKNPHSAFSGLLQYYNMQGNIEIVQYWKNGKLVDEGKPQNDEKSQLQKSSCTFNSVTVYHYTDWYVLIGGSWSYRSTFYHGSSIEYEYVCSTGLNPDYDCKCSDPYGGGSGPTRDVYTEEYFNPPATIIDSSLTPCARGILLQLMLKDEGQDVIPNVFYNLSQYILDFFNSSKDFHLEFKIEQLGFVSGNEVNGRNRPTEGKTNSWDIVLDTDLVNNGTQLFTAKTLIHEILHAHLRVVNKSAPLSDLTTEMNTFYNNNQQNLNLTHHEFMGEFVEAMANSLAKWDNNRNTLNYYRKLSWGGLETSSAYQALTNKGEIQTVIQNERYNKIGAEGEPCNPN